MACCKQDGNIPVESDSLKMLLKYGAKSSTNSLIKLVGMGSCSQELDGAPIMTVVTSLIEVG